MNSRFTNTFEDGTFIKYLVYDCNNELYYVGSGNYTENINKAKVYYRLCDARNAVTAAKDNAYIKKNGYLKVVEYTILQRIDNIREV